MDVKTILVPTDFSETAQAALEAATSLAKQFGAKIIIVHAYHAEIPMVVTMDAPYALPPGFYEELSAEAQRRVDKLADEITSRDGVKAEGIAMATPAATAIIERAESMNADLIVMGTHGHTGVKHLLLGSIAERVVRTAPCPVMTVNPPHEVHA